MTTRIHRLPYFCHCCGDQMWVCVNQTDLGMFCSDECANRLGVAQRASDLTGSDAPTRRKNEA